MRLLTSAELALVAGGSSSDDTFYSEDIYVTYESGGHSNEYYFADYDYREYDEYGGGGGGGGGGGVEESTAQEGNGLTEQQEETTKKTIEALKAALEANIAKHGDAVIIKLPNGMEVRAGALLDSLGKTLDILEAGKLAYQAANGNLDVAATAGFVAGLLGGAAVGALGAGPIAVFVAGAGIGMATEWALSGAIDHVNAEFTRGWNEQQQANPHNTPGVNLLQFLQQIWGIPVNERLNFH